MLAAPHHLFAVVALAAAAGSAHAAVMITGNELPMYQPISNQLALSHGATFASTLPYCTFGTNGANVDGIYGTDPSFPAQYGNAAYYAPIEITFVSMNDGVTPAIVNGTINAVYGDGGGDIDGVRLRAYDINNVLLGTVTALGVTFTNISISGAGIHRIVFDQSGLGDPTSDTFLDWVQYPEPVVVPGPGVGSAIALASVAPLLRRRRPR